MPFCKKQKSANKALKRVFACFCLFGLLLSALAQNTVDADEADNSRSEPLPRCIRELVENYFVEVAATGGEIAGYIDIRDRCVSYKSEATQCCSNPNACSGLIRDIVQNALPLAPALYSAYQGFQTSQKLSSNKISRAEANAKMCDVQNKTNMGGFLSQLLLQMGTMIQTTCSDRIKTCQSQCNNAIKDFRDRMKKCFSERNPQTGLPKFFHTHTDKIERMIEFAEKYLEIEKRDNEFTVNNLQEAKKGKPEALGVEPLNSEHLCADQQDGQLLAYYISNPKVNLDECTGQDTPICSADPLECQAGARKLETRPLRYLILLGRAYKNSSEVRSKAKKLSEKSDEKDIVNCSHQPNRVATNRTGAKGGPVPTQGLIKMCQQVTDSIIHDKPTQLRRETRRPGAPPPGGPGRAPSKQGAFTSFEASTKAGPQDPGVVDFDKLALGPGDEEFSTNNKPPLSENLPSFGGSPGGGASPGGGGSPGGGASPGGGGSPGAGSSGTDSAEEDDYAPVWGADPGGAGAGFAGGDSPGFGGGGGKSPGGAGRVVTTRTGKKNDKDSKDKDFDSSSGSAQDSPPDGKNIFDIAGRRIRQFCADYRCKE